MKEQRKSLPRASLARIYHIDREIASGKYPNADKLAKGYETSKATIHRDIDYMRNFLEAPIEYNARHRGYYYTEKTFRLPARYAAAEDMLALGMAKSLLRLYQDTPLYDSAKRLLDEITLPLTQDDTGTPGKAPPGQADKSPWYEKRVVVPPVASAPVKPELWQTIIDGIRENHLITFDYQGMDDRDYKTRLVRPYQLLFQDGMWYLYGYAEERKAVRTFSLSRMENAALTNETFELSPNYDFFCNHDGSYFGVYLGKKYYFKIWFSNDTARYIEERQWASNQKIKKAEKGDGIIIHFTSAQFKKVLWWVLSYGSGAFPLEPPELVKEWEQNVEGMRKHRNKVT
ncbi:putative helix-turn-helix, type 11 domain protein [Treponema primitia ZAS-2]|uniref:Putative helix-turn-helix, type 11 domain protein n=1 Tax=Treponema primitia (strain ATCC BAA-887 / DSM 12427 / ZAS-2) TaxID=545694 RepID=F5YL57_TREPZ|nr:WYL domain-containing protein [Treponema primitia]AEF86058.1 putative helix-turn-helix, type 11 domain protein [Treponema primitia ZAS-2]